ncbi:MAG TPA: hypothetical protein VE978_26205 [Chitinophagales bacterium]|nr:hypothetical protein [Chitinophagales bacterium]
MKEIASAQVILKWSESPPNSKNIPITSDSINNYKIDISTAKKVMDFFSEKNFEVGKIVANSFSITSSIENFQKFFNVNIKTSKHSGLFISPGNSRLLPLKNLPEEIREHVDQITFVEPVQLFSM